MEFIGNSNISRIAHLESTLHKLVKLCSMAKSVEEVLVAVNADTDLEHRSNKFVFKRLKEQQSGATYMQHIKPRVKYMPSCCAACKLELKTRYRLGVMLLDIKRHLEGVRIVKEFSRNNSIDEAHPLFEEKMRKKRWELNLVLIREDQVNNRTRVEYRQILELCQGLEVIWLAQLLDTDFHFNPL